MVCKSQRFNIIAPVSNHSLSAQVCVSKYHTTTLPDHLVYLLCTCLLYVDSLTQLHKIFVATQNTNIMGSTNTKLHRNDNLISVVLSNA